MTRPTPDTLREIAHRIRGGIAFTEDAAALEWAATQWLRCEIALNEIADDALEQARTAEAEALARYDAMRSPVVVQFPTGRDRVSGGLT